MAKATNKAYADTYTCKYRFVADGHSPHVKIIKYVDKGKRVLDIGCATGSFSIPLARPIICLTILSLTFPMFVAKRYIKELKSSEALPLILRSLGLYCQGYLR